MLTYAALPLALLAAALLVRRMGVERVRTALGDWVDRVNTEPPGEKKQPNSDSQGDW